LDPIVEAVREQDEKFRELKIWVGAEPTYTRRDSTDAAWIGTAEGADKEERARALLDALTIEIGHSSSIARWIGRKFPGEDEPRFCFALAWLRDEGELPTIGELDRPSNPVALDPARYAVLTVTPDPGVVEVNTAPCPSLEDFLAQVRAIDRAAAQVGLSPFRYRWNGDLADSGGGGQITLGGPSPEESPFFRYPTLLPSLVRYFNRHPSLSYAFAMECIGAAGQAPRPDEGTPERFEELTVAVERCSFSDAPKTPAEIAAAFADLLVDGSGNRHRAELNVEKLWNEGHPRGRMGVVEFRALSMQPTPERTTAIAALLRAISARAILSPVTEPLIDWGRELHDRFSLPWFLARDLEEVLADLDAHGVGLPPALRALLAVDPEPIVELNLAGSRLSIRRAREFWPLVGDVASQEYQTSRLVDPSTERIEVRVEGQRGDFSVEGWALPLVTVAKDVHVAYVRRRAFVPLPGLHPGLPAHDPLDLVYARGGESVAIALHAWRPDGEAYEVLPDGSAEAERRRKERVKVTATSIAKPPRTIPAHALSKYGVDLRRLPPPQ
jgi:uncharacterized protein (DUF2126 family)